MIDVGLVALGIGGAGLATSLGLLVPRQPLPRLADLVGPARRCRRRDPLDAAIGRVVADRLGADRVAAIRRDLLAAGRSGPSALHRHLGRRTLALAVAVALGSAAAVAGSPLPLGLAVAGAWLAGDGSVRAAARRRADRIDAQLPDVLDVVAVLLGAGLGFRAALARVADAMPGPVADEVHHLLHRLELGASRREAFAAARDRNRSEAFDAFVAALLQAEDLGTPLSDALVALAADLRRGAAQRARRRAARTTPRVSLVLTLVIVPASLALLLAGLLLGSGVDVGVHP